ncbi:uncharacterized protein METZ01_LOCUS401012, partial [marine metagenome]
KSKQKRISDTEKEPTLDKQDRQKDSEN